MFSRTVAGISIPDGFTFAVWPMSSPPYRSPQALRRMLELDDHGPTTDWIHGFAFVGAVERYDGNAPRLAAASVRVAPAPATL